MKTKLNKYMMAALAAMLTLLSTASAYAQSSPETAKVENARWYALAAALGLGIAAFSPCCSRSPPRPPWCSSCSMCCRATPRKP